MIVKDATEEHQENNVEEGKNGVSVLKEPCDQWNELTRIICVDSYFGSVSAAESMMNLGLHFTGVIKPNTEPFSLKYFDPELMFKKRNHLCC